MNSNMLPLKNICQNRSRISPVTVIGLLFCTLLQAFAARAQVKNIGPVVSYERIPGGVRGKTNTAIFQVQVYNEHTIRVQVSKEKVFNDFSYALVNNTNATPPPFSASEQKGIIHINTNSIHAEIIKAPSFRIVFKSGNGEVLNEDVEGDCFGTTFIGNKVSVYKKMQEGERFIGMGEALGDLDKRGTGITLNNTDTYKYGDPRLPMYVSVPFYIGVHHRQQYGIFFNNSYKALYNFGLSTPGFTSVNMDGGDADYFFMYDQSVSAIIGHYTALTGRIQLPPLWSIGYHQSRCSYYPQSRVEWIAHTFRQKKIPLDCIVLDADYQQGYQPFRVNKERFPDLPALAAGLAKQHIELTASVYPAVAIDSTYHSYVDGLKNDVFVKYSDGSLFATEIAPVKCYLPDYTNPKARAWWQEKMKWFPQNGINGYWNDMNEPALGGSYLPDNLLFDFDGRKANALEAKNVYGFQMARSSYEAALQNSPSKRPFVLSRSGFAGIQRYAAVWSGDNTASDEGLLSSVLLNTQMGLSGIAFCGNDIGGFIGDRSKDLFKRWIEVGVFSPFCRNHAGCGSVAGEPWAYDDEAEAISKSYIGFRYRLLPYLYAAFFDASQTGMPVARSLAIPYPYDDKVYNNQYQYQFLFGNDIMVVPVTSTEKSRQLYLPGGEWYNIYDDEKLSGGRELTEEVPIYQVPVFVKAGAVIPLQSLVQSTKDMPSDTLELHLFNGEGDSRFTYYEDEGDGFGYKKEVFCKKEIRFSGTGRSVLIGRQQGSFTSVFTHIKLVLHGFNSSLRFLKINGTPQAVSLQHNGVLLDPLQGLEDIYDAAYFNSLQTNRKNSTQQSLVIDNSSEPILVEW